MGLPDQSFPVREISHIKKQARLDGRACSQTIGVKRKTIEHGLLAGIKDELLSDEAVQTAINAAHRILNEAAEQPAADTDRIAARLSSLGEKVCVLGKLVAGNGKVEIR